MPVKLKFLKKNTLMGCPRLCSGKEPTASGGDTRDMCLIPGSERSPRGGNGNPLLCPCLENPMGRGAWQATVCGFGKRQTQLSTHTCITDSLSVYLKLIQCCKSTILQFKKIVTLKKKRNAITQGSFLYSLSQRLFLGPWFFACSMAIIPITFS